MLTETAFLSLNLSTFLAMGAQGPTFTLPNHVTPAPLQFPSRNWSQSAACDSAEPIRGSLGGGPFPPASRKPGCSLGLRFCMPRLFGCAGLEGG